MKGLIYLPKVKIKYFLKTENELEDKNLYGIYHNEIITFKDNDVITNILLNDNVLKRENKDYIITINFNNLLCKYYLKEYNKSINFNISINEYLVKDNNICINYDIIYDNRNKVNILFNLSYEVIKC